MKQISLLIFLANPSFFQFGFHLALPSLQSPPWIRRRTIEPKNAVELTSPERRINGGKRDSDEAKKPAICSG